jgi:hypothetical protein
MTLDESPRLSDWLKGETQDPPFYCRESVTVLAGEQLQTGDVVGKITATGKYAAFDPDASDGTETAAGVLISQSLEGDTAADQPAAILARGPAVVRKQNLGWGAGVDSNDKAAAYVSLEALGIQCETGA